MNCEHCGISDSENNSIDDIDTLRELLERHMEEHNIGTGYGEVQIK